MYETLREEQDKKKEEVSTTLEAIALGECFAKRFKP
jgi:hypothetical protein